MAYIFPSIWNRESRNELNKLAQRIGDLPKSTDEIWEVINERMEKIETDGLLLSNKGEVFPLEIRSGQKYPLFENAFLDVKVYNAEEGAIYRISHISKNNTTWGDPITFIEVGKSFDNGASWDVIISRGKLTLPNNQTSVKSHVLTINEIDEIFVVALDWNELQIGSNNLGIYNYIISPINYVYFPEKKGEDEVKQPDYMNNAGLVFPLKILSGTAENSRYNLGILDVKVHYADPGAIYRISHISKDNTAWGNPLTFIEIGRSYDKGVTWEVINARGQVTIPNGQKNIQTHIIDIKNNDEIFTITLNWNYFTEGSSNLGAADYIIDPILYLFRNSSKSKPINDLGDSIVAKKEDRKIMFKQRYDDTRNLIVEFNSVGINGFHEFRSFYVQDNTAKDSDFNGELMASSGTDWISPYGMLAVNNPMGSNAGSVSVGGSHGTEANKGFPTGSFINLSKYELDGTPITTTAKRGTTLNITAEHHITASNAINKVTGNYRHTAKEYRIYSITSGDINVRVEVEALEDILLTRYAGFMMPMLSAYFTHFYLYDTKGEIGVFRSGGLPEGLPDGIYHTESKDYQAIDRAVLVHQDILLVMRTDRTFGIGTGEFAPESTAESPQSPILYTGGRFGKISAHNLGGSSNEYLLKTGEKISYRGGYHFVEYEMTEENVFEYEINGITQIDDLRGE